jgi:hypothetical protein
MKLPSQCLPLPEMYYDSINMTYWRANASGGWQKISESSLDTELVIKGYAPKPDNGELLSEVQLAKHEIQYRQDVVYSGPLAGYKQGFYEILGNRILVTQSPKLIEPKAGNWDTIRQLIENLLRNETTDQTDYFYGWMKNGYISLRNQHQTPGQCLTLAGPAGCGKSLLQNLITQILGGRVAKPYQFMTGKTHFNAELFGSEHLMVEDEPASTDIRTRHVLGSFIKMFTVNSTQNCHGKNKQAITLTPCWRLSISVNDEPEHLMVLPPLGSDSVSGKIMLLRAFQRPMPMPTNTDEEKAVFWKQLLDEVPAFLDFLMHYEIPDELKDSRCGIRTYHNSELLAALGELQPEIRLLNIIDNTLFGMGVQGMYREFGVLEWEGPAIDLQRRLTLRDASHEHEAKQLLNWANACGTYLGRLAKQFPNRVTSRGSNGTTIWRIVAPSVGAQPDHGVEAEG